MFRSCPVFLLRLTLFAIALTLAAQAPVEPPPGPTFRSGIDLVQVSVVAKDKKGSPVADLSRGEFQVFDNGVPQEIRLFIADSGPDGPALPAPDARYPFTNRITPSGLHGGYSVILIDSIFTDFGDPFKSPGSANARTYALRALRSIPAGERVAIYAMDRLRLQVVCEFTSDRDLLEAQLAQWRPLVDTPDTNADILPPAGGLLDPNGEVRLAAIGVDTRRRIESNNQEIAALAEHLAGVQGRKNLIWLSTRFVIAGPFLQKLSNAGVAIYPVHLSGVACSICSRVGPTESINAIAAQTGGVAYYGRNDLDVAIREAMDDGQVSYTLGFYQSDGDRKPAAHQISVQTGRPGIVLRYRTSYRTEPTQAPAKTDMARALNQPIDSTAVAIKAVATRLQDRLDLKAVIDTAALDLKADRNVWKGSIELAARFRTADGHPAGDLISQAVNIHLGQTTYEGALQNGISIQRRFSIPGNAVELRLLVGNPATGKTGTLTIPISGVPASKAPENKDRNSP